MPLKYNFIAENQYGDIVWIKNHPRKELLAKHNRKHADKIYVDDIAGNRHHVGYVIAGNWYQIVRTEPWK